MQFRALVEYSDKLRQVRSKIAKVDLIVDLLRRLNKEEVRIGVPFLEGRIRQGRLNITWKGLTTLLDTPYRESGQVGLTEVDSYLCKANTAKGRHKVEALLPLFEKMRRIEREHLIALITQQVQQGAAGGLVKLAIAKVFGLSDDEIERAQLRKPDLGELFEWLSAKGRDGLQGLSVTIFSPIKPMLAQIAPSLDDLFADNEELAIEHKLDGVRIQVHRDQEEVQIFSRHLKDITGHFPELVDAARNLPARRFILDGEAIAIDDKGRPVPFQILARRTTRKKDIARMQRRVPVVPRFFDVLYAHGDDLTARSYTERTDILRDIVRDKEQRANRIITVRKKDARDFYDRSLDLGNEGVMVKLPDSRYRPGMRGSFWFKIKAAHTADCVILAAEWGHGRRKGLLSNLHLGILDETKTKYLMVGKTFKGLTDKMLQWLTDNLPRHKVHEDDWTLYLRPEVVVEVAFNEVQKSPRYDSGMALRFARVKRIRTDKTAAEIDTVISLRKAMRGMEGGE